jgi:hypothetical protein
LRQRKHLVEGFLKRNEPPLGERSPCMPDLVLGKLQVARDRRRRVVAQAPSIADEDEEEVEEDLAGLEALEVPIPQEPVVDPAEGSGNDAESLGPEDSFGDHAREGSARASRRRSSLLYRRRIRAPKRALKSDTVTTSGQIESCISALGISRRSDLSLANTLACSQIESCISALAFLERS